MDIDQTLEQSEKDTSSSERNNRIQILDLHTQNPLVSYQNQLYSCEWTSTLGTDVLLTAPTPEFPHPILREQPNVSVLATSSIKLMGRPAQISSRHPAEEASTPAPESSAVSAANRATPEKAAAAAATTIKIPLGPTPTRARQTQANFLERLIAIKAKKGEKDDVTIYIQNVNQGSGWRSQRKAVEDGDETGPSQQQSQTQRGQKATTGRPRGSRRTGGPRTAKGGLFRDYRPQLWDTPGADIRAGSTPESWDQLESGGRANDETQTQTQTQLGISASPLPAEQPVQTTCASADASHIPSPRPGQSVNGEDTENGTLSPSLGPQQAVVGEEDSVPADIEMDDV